MQRPSSCDWLHPGKRHGSRPLKKLTLCSRLILSKQRKMRERVCECMRACARGKKDGKGILIFLIRNTANRGREREVDRLTRTHSLFHTHTHAHMWLSFSAFRVVTSCRSSVLLRKEEECKVVVVVVTRQHWIKLLCHCSLEYPLWTNKNERKKWIKENISLFLC